MKFVRKRQTAALRPPDKPGSRALILTALLMAMQFMPSQAQAQRTPTRDARPSASVPLRRTQMLDNATYLPSDVAVRSVKGVKGFEKVTRAQIGGSNGASVVDQVVNLTQTTGYNPGAGQSDISLIDKRVPVWSADERFLYFAGTAANSNGRFGLFRIASDNPTNAGSLRSEALTNPTDSGFDYYFPAINQNQTRIAFARSSDNRNIDGVTKRFDLYVSDMPTAGNFINTAALGNTNLRSLTAGRLFPNSSSGPFKFINVGRVAWVGGTDVVFSAQLGDNNDNNDDDERRTARFHIFTVNIQSAQIFQLTDGAGDERNPQVSPDGRFIAFDSDATSRLEVLADPASTAYNNTGTRVRTEQDPAATPASARAAVAGGPRNIFTMTTLGQNVRQFTSQYAGADTGISSYQPTWSSSQPNNFTNTNTQTFYIGFASNRVPTFPAGDTTFSNTTGYTVGPANRSAIYYAIATRDGGATPLLGEVDPADRDNVTADGARRLETGNTTRQTSLLEDPRVPRFRDQYPTFAPFIKSFRVGFQSNREGGLNTNGVGAGFTETPTNNLFIASLIDITAPTLIRYNTNNPVGEVVHVNLVTNAAQPYNRSGATQPYDPAVSVRSRADGLTPGSEVFFTVRVDDREAGMRPENSPDGGAVFLQIKNPNSRYQTLQQGGALVGDATRGEHKEFTNLRGSPYVAIVNGAPYFWSIPGTSAPYLPTNYNPGHEFEAQAISAFSVDPTIARAGLQGNDTAGGINSAAVDRSAVGTNYFSHIGNSYGSGILPIPGVQDAAAFSGINLPPLDGLSHNGVVTKNVWLRLVPLVELDAAGIPVRDGSGNTKPLRATDQLGGVLYGAKWRTPSEASDWYIDVIAYDNAVNPFDASQRSNVIIYDNVWGFSTAPPISGQPTDILVVADYTLGQKFFSSRYGARPTDDESTGNLQPLFWGTESYYTDTDVRRFPSEAVAQPRGAGTTAPLPLWGQPGAATPFRIVDGGSGVNGGGQFNNASTPNVLGVAAYNDEQLNSGAVVIDTGVAGQQYVLPPTARYNIWRILSRGPVPQALLQDYLPQITSSPADTSKGENAPRTVINSQRCVVWASPFSGNLFVGSGTITDISAQDSLTAFVQAGGRLFISGQDIGFAIGRNGDNRFYNEILRANFVTDDVGVGAGLTAQTPANAAFVGYTNQFTAQPWNTGNSRLAYGQSTGAFTPINVGGPGENGNLRYYSGTVTDASPVGTGYVDGITPRPSAAGAPDSVSLFTYGGGSSAVIASAYPAGATPVGEQLGYSQTSGAVTPQGRVVYMAAGFESVSQGWYNYTIDTQQIWTTLGRRTQLMNNIVGTFRTGTITGKMIDTDGRPVNDALVRAILNTADDTAEAYGTALTDDNGNFQIVGLPPGYYVLYGYKAGFYTQHNTGNSVQGGWRSTSAITLKRAGPGALSGVRSGTVSIGGVFADDGVTPVPNIEIQVRRREANGTITMETTTSSDGTRTVVLPDGTRTTLPAGAYILPSLLIGEYQVYANSRQTVRNGVVREKEGAERATINPAYGEIRVGVSPANTYRLGTDTSILTDTAANNFRPALLIQEGKTAQIDFLLQSAPQQVTGRVVVQTVDENNNNNRTNTDTGIANAVVQASLNGTVVAQATTGSDGRYTLTLINPATGADPTQLPGGTYTISATANGYTAGVPATVTVRVGGSVEPSVQAPVLGLVRLRDGSVSGTIRRNDGTTTSTTGVRGATVTFYAVTTINGVETQSANAAVTATVENETPVTANGISYNYRVASIAPGIYNAYVNFNGLTGDPVRRRVEIKSEQETTGVDFTLQPPRIFGAGIQLLSLPGDYTSVSSETIFGLSGSTPAQFNIAEWIPNPNYNPPTDNNPGRYQIDPSVPIRAGKGYFVKFDQSKGIVNNGTPVTVGTAEISLVRGWNLIGHPFTNTDNVGTPAADIDLTSTTFATFSYTTDDGTNRANVSLAQAVADNAVQNVVYYYTGSQQGSNYVQDTRLQPYLGYWYRAFRNVTVTLRYPGAATRKAGDAGIRATPAEGGTFKTITRAQVEAPTQRKISSRSVTDWLIQITAEQGDLKDTDNSVGVAADAKDGFDNRYDHEKPPMISEAAGVYVAIEGQNADGRATEMADNLLAPGANRTWRFTVRTTAKDKGDITVLLPRISQLPRKVEPVLVDEATGKRVFLRSTPSFRFTPNGESVRRFRLEVTQGVSLPLDITSLYAVPNGRATGGSGYQFRFRSTGSGDAKVELTTATGKHVRTMRSRATAGSESTVAWDGRDDQGNLTPPGGYILSLTIQDERGAQATRSVMVMSLN